MGVQPHDPGPYDTGPYDIRLYDSGPKFDIYSLYHIFTTNGLVSTQVASCQSFLGQVEFRIFVPEMGKIL